MYVPNAVYVLQDSSGDIMECAARDESRAR